MDSKGTYAKLLPDTLTSQKVAAMVGLLNVENGISARDLHVTVVYSRVEVPAINNTSIKSPITAKGIGFDIYPNPDGTKCLILHLDSEQLHKLHNDCRAIGATHDYPAYNPHLTLSYDYTSDTVPGSTWLEYFTLLEFDQIVVEPLVINWRPNEQENIFS